MRRALTILVVVVGAAMIVLPLSLSMFGRAGDGKDMVDDFRPIMQPASVQKTADYYAVFDGFETAFNPMMTEEAVQRFQGYMQGMAAMQEEFPQMLAGFAQQSGTTPEQLQQQLATQYPAVMQAFAAFPQMGEDFAGILGTMQDQLDDFAQLRPGLVHYGDLVDRMERNVDTYASVDKLPAMSLFPWFFVIPGVLLLAAGGWLLALERRPEETPAAQTAR